MNKAQNTGYRYIKAKPIAVVTTTHVPGTNMEIVRHVVPEPQRLGLYHKDYTGAPLRENLGLSIPHGDFE